MSAPAKMTPAKIHLRYLGMLINRGTKEEADGARATLAEIVQVIECAQELGYGAALEPLEEITIPDFLIKRSARVAIRRFQRVKEYDLEDKLGIQRDLTEEMLSIQGGYAAAIMLGLSLTGVEQSHQTARAHGNLGDNRSSFTPSVGNLNLLIPEKAPAAREFFLVNRVGATSYRLERWGCAGPLKRPEFQRTFVRRGVTGRPYLIVPEALRPLTEWFGE